MIPTTIDNSSQIANFPQFFTYAFATLNPGRPLVNNWHLQLLIASLKEVELGRITRLIINIPPRSLKSTMISVAWPAWLLGQNPANKIIVASYSQALSFKHSQDTKVIMESEWYKKQYPNAIITKGKNTQRKFITSQQGFRMATSVGATLTGEGADVIIVDDPQTAAHAMSRKYQQRAKDWYEQTLMTRLNDLFGGKVIIVMQRLHQDDLSGYLLRKMGYDRIILPLHAVDGQDIQIGDQRFYRDPGHILYKNWSMDEVHKVQAELGSYTFAAQYQQNPHLTDCVAIKKEWVKRYNQLPADLVVYQSWDCAIKIGSNNDYSVCTTWGMGDRTYYLIDVLRKRLEYSDLKRQVVELYKQHQATSVIIEDKASGQQLLQELRLGAIPVIGRQPVTSKENRVLAALSSFENGNVYWPEYAYWLAEYEAEMFTFPHATHDDQMDSTVQFINWANEHLRRMQIFPRVSML